MTLSVQSKAKFALAGAACLSMAMGQVHGFSVFLDPLETGLGIGRASAAFAYSLALVSITGLVLVGHWIYGRFPTWALTMLASIGAAIGLGIAAAGVGIAALWLGYGVIFGAANGLGYGFALQFSAKAKPRTPGFAMGAVTAAYAFGAVVSPGPIGFLATRYGFDWGLLGLAVSILGFGAVAASFLAVSEVTYKTGSRGTTSGAIGLGSIVGRWLAYGAAVCAGLIIIGHAAGLAADRAPGLSPWIAAAVLAAANLFGSLAGGLFADKAHPKWVLFAFPILTFLGLVSLSVSDIWQVFLVGMITIGFAYGGTIAAWPAAISSDFGRDNGPRAYGYIFTAWGAAGLIGPWGAAQIFDSSGGYSHALSLAAVLALISAASAYFIHHRI